MKKTLLGAALVMAAVTNNAAAGGLQLDPTGTGSVANSNFLTSFGSSFGNFLAENSVAGTAASANTTLGGTTVWAHNSVPVTGGELSYIMSIPMTSSLTGPTLELEQFAAGFFEMWFDTTPDANQETGLGYGDGVLIISGFVTTVPPTSFGRVGTTLATLAAGQAGALAASPSIAGNGSMDVEVNLTFSDPLFVINDVTSDPNDIDLALTLGTRLRYTTGAGNRVSSTFGDGTVVTFLGADATNDYDCGALQFCDVVMQTNTTFEFAAGRVPEPGSLALLGAGLGLLGAARLRRGKKEA